MNADSERERTAQDEAAAAVRRLAHALVSRIGDEGVLAQVTAATTQLAAQLEQQPPLDRGPDAMQADRATGPPADGQVVEHYDRCPVSGPANPFATDIVARRVGDEVHCTVTLGPGCEGPPGHAHGGIIAALFDDATAFLMRIVDETCMASELTVRYRRPVPLGVLLAIDARVAGRDGRRIHTEAEMRHGDVVVARATCVKVNVDR